jgi:hypothetical protein
MAQSQTTKTFMDTFNRFFTYWTFDVPSFGLRSAEIKCEINHFYIFFFLLVIGDVGTFDGNY